MHLKQSILKILLDINIVISIVSNTLPIPSHHFIILFHNAFKKKIKTVFKFTVIQALANNGVSLAGKDVRGSTPLHLASAHGNSFTLHTILRTGVNVNEVDRNGWTPVHSAAYHGRLGCLQMLNKWGGHLDDVDNNGNTPAHLAAMEGQLPCLKYLVTTSGSPNHTLGARSDHGETPKDLAQQFYKETILEYINNIEWERDHPEEAENLAFPAHVASYNGDLDHLRMLVENGVVNINERDDKGSTPAHKAAGQGHIHILQWLVEMGADLDILNQAGESPRDIARRFSQLACVKLLGGDPEQDTEMVDDELDETDEDEVDFERSGQAGRRSGSQSRKQQQSAKGRAKKRMNELERLLEIAKRNYTQLGGRLTEDRKRIKDTRDKDHTIRELEAQLDYEKLRREKLEAQLDEYGRELAYLNSQLENIAVASDEDYNTRSGRAKRRTGSSKKKSHDDGGVFVRRNYAPGKKPQSGRFRVV
ncbi:ankyrin repeat domain-containing protein 42-like [Gigantopelta aegis]|uniref:ankyrin repeat domain-containing protein 42-like n=1 Tax=Gigantopelta aegis TaxID=1735272 RepID=UPI001B88C07D|nr:ankyrin repeat domain-containing protein 42-like [Gigantopelta aegis]